MVNMQSTSICRETSIETSGSFSIWKVDLRHSPISVSEITDIPERNFLNGMTLLPTRPQTVLIGDSATGVVFRVDTVTGAYAVVLSDPSMKSGALPELGLGINGKEIRDNYLYYNAGTQTTFNRIPIHVDGTAAGPAALVVAMNAFGDDFTFDESKGTAYVATDLTNEILRNTPLLPVQANASIVIGALYQATVAGPTALEFGRTHLDRNTLYVMTNGGLGVAVNGTYVEAGRVYTIST